MIFKILVQLALLSTWNHKSVLRPVFSIPGFLVATGGACVNCTPYAFPHPSMMLNCAILEYGYVKPFDSSMVDTCSVSSLNNWRTKVAAGAPTSSFTFFHANSSQPTAHSRKVIFFQSY